MSVLNLLQIDKLDMRKHEDQQTAARMIDDVYRNAQSFMQRLAYVWDENIRFFEGDQHIYFNTVTKQFEVIPLTKYNRFIPRPVTNYILPTLQTMQSILTKNKPNSDINPNSKDPQDVNAAKIAGVIQDTKWEDDDEQTKLVDSALIALLTGTVVRKDYWDSSLGPVSKKTGKPVGDNAVEILSPFEFIPDIQNGSYYVESSVQPISWVHANYDQKGQGFTGMAKEVKPEENLSTMMSVFERLKTAIGVNDGLTSGKSQSPLTNATVVKTCYIQPTKEHPDGLCIVTASGLPLYIGKSPYYDPKIEDSWHPYSFFKWNDVFFRWHGMSLVEHLVPLQRRVNSIDSLIILNRMTMVNPQWLLPKGCGVPEGYINGQPGLNIWYSPVGANGARPEKSPGIGLPADIYRERDQVVQDMHQIAGDNMVLQGEKPEGLNTASGLSMLLEQAYSKFSPVLQRWEKFIESGQQKKLALIANRYKENRPEFMKRMQALNRENNEVEINAFVGSDLRDNVNIKIEAGSTLPRSSIAEKDNYMQAAQAGLLGPLDPTQNPIGNQKFLEKVGLTGFTQDIGADVKKAKFVVGTLVEFNRGEVGEEVLKKIVLREWEINPQTIQMHLQILTDYMKNPNFEDEKGVFQLRWEELNAALASLQQPQGELPPAPAPQPDVAPVAAPGMPPELEAILSTLPPEIQQQVIMALESGMPIEEIIAQLTQAQGAAPQGITTQGVPPVI